MWRSRGYKEYLEMKTTVHDEKYTGVNSGLDIEEEDICELEDITIETIHNETLKDRRILKMK